MSSKKGFTLIELLVVISIIGLLSSVVLASLANARLKGADGAIKSDMNSIRTTAGLDYETFGGKYNTTGNQVYTNVCSTVVTPGTILVNINKAVVHMKSVNGNQEAQCNINAAGSAYMIAVPMRTTNTFWCIDSTGVSRSKNAVGVNYSSFTGSGTSPFYDNNDVTCN